MTCHACQPADAPTPLAVENRPGLTAIGYRVGTFSAFREGMLERLSRTPGLAELTTREDSDYTVSFIDLWSAVLDVLTFYQERFANEAFLRTATERESVARLAALIDYHLRPGVAATTWLAFGVETGKRLAIHSRMRAQNLPAPGQRPQTFETTGSITADAAWNAVRVYASPVETNWLAAGGMEVTLDRGQGPAVAAALAPGQTVLIVNDGKADPVEEKEIATLDAVDDRTILRWTMPVQGSAWSTGGAAPSRVFRRGRTFRLFGHDAPDQYLTPEATDNGARVTWNFTSVTSHAYPVAGFPEQVQTPGEVALSVVDWRRAKAEAVRTSFAQGPRAAIAGVTTRWRLDGGGEPRDGWLGGDGGGLGDGWLDGGGGTPNGGGGTPAGDGSQRASSVYLCLDGTYPRLAAGMVVLVDDVAAKTVATVVGVDQVQESLGPLTRSVSRLQLSKAIATDDRRGVVIHELLTEILVWNESYPAQPLLDSAVVIPGSMVVSEAGESGILAGRTIQRNAFVGGTPLYPSRIDAGRTVLVGNDGGTPVEAQVADATIEPAGARQGDFAHLRLTLKFKAKLQLQGSSAIVRGNITPATHGETVAREVLGSGNAATTFQRFQLKKKPLTYVPSATPAGAETTLEVRVNGVRWNEVSSLYGQPPTAPVYITRLQDDDSTIVQFGDGVTGATVPSGAGNVTATYRTGLGLAGRLDAAAISMPVDRPPGLTGVTNPTPSSGGADSESREVARVNAPRTVRTFGRAVSLGDLEDLVRSSGVVAKAQAIWLWDGFAHAAHVTVAGQGGGLLSEHDLNLLTVALSSARDPNYRVALSNYQELAIRVEARLLTDPAREQATVLGGARQALVDALSFDRLNLGQALPLSRLYTILQAVEGVVAVDVTRFQLKRPPLGIFQPACLAWIPARSARPDSAHRAGALPAQLIGVESPADDIVITASSGGRT